MSKTILCADDSVTMQRVAEITLQSTEFTYVGAKSADEALAKAREHRPVLILADAVMPGTDGYELCAAIKADSDLASVPVVVMCGKSQVYDSARGTQVGVDDHVTKPWDTQGMLDKLAELLEKAGSEGVAQASMGDAPAAAAPAVVPSKPAAPAKPVAPSIPSIPNAARSATIMGMPTVKPPMKTPSAPGVTSMSAVKPLVPTKPVVPGKPLAPSLPSKNLVPAKPAPVAAKPAPVAAKPAPAAAAVPAGIGRPPMIKGIPTKGLKPISAQVAQKVAAAAAGVAREAGLDPAGAEMQALLKLSAEVIERIAWEVVPELAAIMIRDNLNELAAKS